MNGKDKLIKASTDMQVLYKDELWRAKLGGIRKSLFFEIKESNPNQFVTIYKTHPLRIESVALSKLTLPLPWGK